MIAGVGIAVAAIREIVTPHHAPAAWTLAVLVVVIVVKETLFRVGQRLSRQSGSTAIQTEAWHHRADAITSLAAAVGISIAVFGGERYWRADDIAALVASGIILYNGWKLLRMPLHELMDADVSADVTNQARVVAAGVARV